MPEPTRRERFEAVVLSHLDAAHNLARWLVRNGADAEDVVQEACLRAYQFFDGYRGESARAWLLAIVRNTAYTWLQRQRSSSEGHQPLDTAPEAAADDPDPEARLLEQADGEALRACL